MPGQTPENVSVVTSRLSVDEPENRPVAPSSFNIGVESRTVVSTASENGWDKRSTIKTATEDLVWTEH